MKILSALSPAIIMANKLKSILNELFIFKHPLCDLSTRTQDYRDALKRKA